MIQDTPDTEYEKAKIAAIRAELPVTQTYAYLNTGTNGPFPKRSYSTMTAYAQHEVEEGRITHDAFARYLQALTQTREAMVDVLRCPSRDIALTHSTTEGINIALMGIDWRPGDEVVTSTTEHPGVLYPIYLLHQRYGVRIRMTEIGLKGHDSLAELRAVLNSRTRAVVLSHVCWTSGMVLPIQELAEETHRAGAMLICDAAQACGMVPSAVNELGVDAYACSGQKWLCGPDGTGALFVRPDRLGDIHQTFIGYWGVRPEMYDNEGNFVPPPNTQRYEATTLAPAGVAAFGTSIQWLTQDVGLSWIYQRIATLGQSCAEALSAIEGVTLFTPTEQMAGLIHFAVDGIAPKDMNTKLAAQGILVRYTPSPLAVRVSLGFYNTEEEVERLVTAVRAIAREK
jgi:L-cysteine/cystine lyase